VDSGNGQVDSILVWLSPERLVEVKLSRNSKLVMALPSSLMRYKAAEETMRAVYLVVDVGSMERRMNA